MNSRGRVIARIAPERDLVEETRLWLLELRGKVLLGAMVASLLNLAWGGDVYRL